MLFKIIFLLDSYPRRSFKFVRWYGPSNTFAKTSSRGMSCVFVVSSLPAVVVDSSLIVFISGLFFASACFFDYTRLCITSAWFYPRSVPYLSSTPQARSQLQTEILIHLLKELAPVNDISGVLSTLCGYFLPEYGKNFSFRVAAHAPSKYQSSSTSGRGARTSYRTMLPEISARRSLLEGEKYWSLDYA